MVSLVKEIYDRRELLIILVQRNLKIRYKNSALGFFWTLLVPLFLILHGGRFAASMRGQQQDRFAKLCPTAEQTLQLAALLEFVQSA